MKLKIFLYSLISLISFTACSNWAPRKLASPEVSLPKYEHFEMVEFPKVNAKQRAGYYLETQTLKGCVLYLQGLGDSVKNHQPYFSHLNANGYRVIYFDYLGQGGSEGSMNKTRVNVEMMPNPTKQMVKNYEQHDKYFAIPEQADFAWEKYKTVRNALGQDCRQSPKIVLGWSTGGLAAYSMAHEKRADAVILLAPGIHPNWFVGKAAENPGKLLTFQAVITKDTLTRNRFENSIDPHIDGIKPKSPAYVPRFAGNLVGIASHSTNWEIPTSINGIVFLSGSEDTYVDREATLKTLAKNAPHFAVQSYSGALHELDNELPEVTTDLYKKSVEFLNSVAQK
ncbi:MAG: alpha/beta fold hydrolase [Bdellovibrionaceae bacterium]|nr:alpha/beta fold hydrolase [Pseudobdellovibrionaceae bacterium]